LPFRNPQSVRSLHSAVHQRIPPPVAEWFLLPACPS
jgi:hypothetical protein